MKLKGRMGYSDIYRRVIINRVIEDFINCLMKHIIRIMGTQMKSNCVINKRLNPFTDQLLDLF